MQENPRVANPEIMRNRFEKVLLILVLDISGSMQGDPINQLNLGVSSMRDYILKDSTLATQLELAIITYDDRAEVAREFDLVLPTHEFPVFTADGTTNLVAGMEKALQMARERKDKLKDEGIRYLRPMIALLTDGKPNPDNDIDSLDKKIQQHADSKGIFLLPFGLGADADLQTLGKIAHVSGEKKPIVYQMDDFSKLGDLFVFLSASAGAVIAGGGAAQPKLDPKIAVPVPIDMDLSI
jgi:uncharacterized protein YegL